MQVYGNNWIRRIVGVKRAGKRRLVGVRAEVEVKDSLKKKMARCWLKWARHVERMGKRDEED